MWADLIVSSYWRIWRIESIMCRLIASFRIKSFNVVSNGSIGSRLARCDWTFSDLRVQLWNYDTLDSILRYIQLFVDELWFNSNCCAIDWSRLQSFQCFHPWIHITGWTNVVNNKRSGNAYSECTIKIAESIQFIRLPFWCRCCWTRNLRNVQPRQKSDRFRSAAKSMPSSQFTFLLITDDSSGCKQAVCNCDKAAALCMGHYSTEYNRSHKRSNFWDWLI